VQLRIKLGSSHDYLNLRGVKSSATVHDIKRLVFDITGVYAGRQRLYLGGEEMPEDQTLMQLFPMSSGLRGGDGCVLQLRCYAPLLISSAQSPGPMLSEIEIAPLNNEPVIVLKRRIRDKYRIELDQQRLHLHPAEMTTFARRCPLSDIRLLSAYLHPSQRNVFLEVIVAPGPRHPKQIFVRIPLHLLGVDNHDSEHPGLRHEPPPGNLQYLEQENGAIQPNTPPPPPPQTPTGQFYKEESQLNPASRKENSMHHRWWFTILLRLDSIIKRDPDVASVASLTSESARAISAAAGQQNRDPPCTHALKLRFAKARSLWGGSVLSDDKKVYADYLLRAEEMFLFVDDEKLLETLNSPPGDANQRDLDAVSGYVQPVFQPLKPLLPLQHFNEKSNRCTMPCEPVRLRWNVPSCATLDCGAAPGATFELSAISYMRGYGSWDIPEHRKTFVEISVEGTAEVGDLGLEGFLLYSSDNDALGFDHDLDLIAAQKAVEWSGSEQIFYVHESLEIEILGPANRITTSAVHLQQSKPYVSQSTELRNSAARQPRTLVGKDDIRNRNGNTFVANPTPLRFTRRDATVQKTTPLDAGITPSWEGSRVLSETIPGKWYVGRERVTDISLPRLRASSSCEGASAFSTVCSRATSRDGRPLLTVTHRRLLDLPQNQSAVVPANCLLDTVRKALDFRIQVQFHICHLVTSDPKSLPERGEFTVRVRQRVARVLRRRHLPDEFTYFDSPEAGMQTTLKVALSTPMWLESQNLNPVETQDLNK